MKKIISSVVVLTIASFAGIDFAHALDDDCGVISTRNIYLTKDQKNIYLIEHNGKRINSPAYISDSINPFNKIPKKVPAISLSLAPGAHEFTARTKTSRFKFTFDVMPNKRYVVIAQKPSDRTLIPVGSEYVAKIKSIKNKICNSSSILPALKKIEKTNHNKELTSELNFKINELTQDLQKFYNQEKGKITLTLPQRINDNFGIVVDRQYPPQNGVLILSVSPNTASNYMGLKANDIILNMNDVSLVSEISALSIFKEQLKNLTYGEDITLKIKRERHIITLTNEYSAIYLPKIKIEIN